MSAISPFIWSEPTERKEPTSPNELLNHGRANGEFELLLLTEMGSGKAVSVESVTKRFGDHIAVRDLSLEVAEGAVYGLLGPNGAGKTTTIRMVLNIIAPDSGSVKLFGQRLRGRPGTMAGYLPEERGLYPRMRVLSHLVFFGVIKGMPRREARAKAEGWLERLGLSEWSQARVDELSRGMRQKVQFIAAVQHEPALLVLDEPLAGLDPANALVLKNVIRELVDDGTTVLLSTHELEQAEALCDGICIIDGGRKVFEGSVDSIKRSYGKGLRELFLEGVAEGDAPHEAGE